MAQPECVKIGLWCHVKGVMHHECANNSFLNRCDIPLILSFLATVVSFIAIFSRSILNRIFNEQVHFGLGTSKASVVLLNDGNKVPYKKIQ